MTSDTRAIVGVALGSVAILLVLGVSLHWPVWLVVVLVVVGTATAVTADALRRRDRRHRLAAQAAARSQSMPVAMLPPPPEYQTVIKDIALRSVLPDYHFMITATVHWRSVARFEGSHVNPGAHAVDSIINRAQEAAATEQPAMYAGLQHRLTGVLGVAQPNQSGSVEAWADQVLVTLPEADLARLRRMAAIRKDREVWEYEREHERSRRAYLADDVLTSTGSALVWWLSRNEQDVAGAVELIGTFARLTAAARNEDVEELFRHLVPPSALPDRVPGFAPLGSDGAGQPVNFQFNGATTPHARVVDLATAMMGVLNLDDFGRVMFAERVAKVIEAAGDATAAQEVRARFDVVSPEPRPEDSDT
ncbi:MAG TPA: hypothetical protein VFW65_34805 [Pseudonocardiaceae bacterium]|nr:hypothetical protein [Pseudonocardiaceae bacterium]